MGQRQGVENLWISRSGERTKLYGKGRQWRARYVDSAGNEHTRRFKYKTDANDWLKNVTRSGADITPPAVGEWTVADQFAAYIRGAAIAETTRATRRHTWNAHVEPRWGKRKLTEVDTAGVKSWVAELAEADTGVPTIENALGVLRGVVKDAISDGRLVHDPTAEVRAPGRKHRRRDYLTHQQVEQLAVATGASATVVRVLAYTGLRWGELAGLTVGAVDLTRRRLQVVSAVAEADGKLVVKTPKDYERRSVPFPAFLRVELAAATAGKGPNDLVFSAANGGHLRISTWRPRVFNNARDRIKDFPTVTPHDLRHTAASLAVSAGANVLALARMLGHEDPSLTLRTYADLFDSDLDALAEVLDRARTSALKPPSAAGNSRESEEENVPGTQEALTG